MTTQSPDAQHAPSYRDAQLTSLLRLLMQWDDLHTSRAETYIQLGNIPAANTCATMILDDQRRAALYDRCQIGFDSADDERLAAVAAMDREVLA